MLTNGIQFYMSPKWLQLKKQCIERATGDDGFVYDELNGERIIMAGDIICHHVIELDDDNVDDYNISLNPENIKVVSFRHHNEIHKRFGAQPQKKVYWIFGAPFSPSKDRFILEHATKDDLICDVSKIRHACTFNDGPCKSTDSIVFLLRDRLLDLIMTRAGKWSNAFIVTVDIDTRMAVQLGAYPLEISDSMDDCLNNLPKYVSPTVVYDFYRRGKVPPL